MTSFILRPSFYSSPLDFQTLIFHDVIPFIVPRTHCFYVDFAILCSICTNTFIYLIREEKNYKDYKRIFLIFNNSHISYQHVHIARVTASTVNTENCSKHTCIQTSAHEYSGTLNYILMKSTRGKL